ncbi:hypothetical protein [Peterkaempfera sp. SMS 1(5)a]|uniref:hypothetical protein n=1 Tax=Peterkaempfera podocarpi TaxID=3232308 RepID=UPI0036707C7B
MAAEEQSMDRESADATVGARTAGQVRAVLEVYGSRVVGLDEVDFLVGMVAACQWALGEKPPPVTGGPAVDVPDPPDPPDLPDPLDPPDLPDLPALPGLPELAAEERAARMVRAGKSEEPVSREYARGAHELLAWICGYTQDVP